MVLDSECQVVIDDKFYEMGPRIPFVTHARGALAINFEPMEMRSACIMTTQSRTRVAWKRLCINIPCTYDACINVIFHWHEALCFITVQTYELSVCEFCLLRIQQNGEAKGFK